MALVYKLVAKNIYISVDRLRQEQICSFSYRIDRKTSKIGKV